MPQRFHEITRATRKLVSQMDPDEMRQVAKDAGVAYTTMRAIKRGVVKEMRLTKALSLAEAVGIRVEITLPS